MKTTRNVVLDALNQSERAIVLAHQAAGLVTEAVCSNKSVGALAADIEHNKLVQPLSPREAMARMLAK